MQKKRKIYSAYVSKHNSNREKQVILLMIPNREKRERSETLAKRANSEGQLHFLVVKKLSALLKRIKSKISDDFYCLSCLHSFRIKNKLESHKKHVRDFSNVILPSEDTKILEFNQYQKSNKASLLFMQILNVQ